MRQSLSSASAGVCWVPAGPDSSRLRAAAAWSRPAWLGLREGLWPVAARSGAVLGALLRAVWRAGALCAKLWPGQLPSCQSCAAFDAAVECAGLPAALHADHSISSACRPGVGRTCRESGHAGTGQRAMQAAAGQACLAGLVLLLSMALALAAENISDSEPAGSSGCRWRELVELLRVCPGVCVGVEAAVHTPLLDLGTSA